MTTDHSGATSSGRREAGKAERKRRIIQAARDMIRETGDAGLSMRGLAARAGVSLATPYNLFGSKRAIVVAVLQDIREFEQRFSLLRFTDPVEKIFAALDMSIDFYLGDPTFYRTLWTAVFDASDGLRGEILNPKRDAFWGGLILGATRAGAIDPAVSIELLLRQLELLLRSAIFDWVVGQIPSDRLGATVCHGYALMLLGSAAPDWRGPLRARLLQAQKALAAPVPAVADMRH